MRRGRILFITGTDTGVGKTVATGLLLYHLRRSGVRALAMKPFCSGDRGDAEVLQSLQAGELTDEEMNPYFFRLPLAPLVAARHEGRRIGLNEVLRRIEAIARRCDCLLVEGCGGLLAPLGEGYTLADVMAKMDSKVLLVSPNKLGVINQVCLTMNALPRARKSSARVVLMRHKTTEISAASNIDLIRELLGRKKGTAGGEKKCKNLKRLVVELPFMGRNPLGHRCLRILYKKLKKDLRALAGKII